MAQDDKNTRPNLTDKGGDDKNLRNKAPRFSIYWVYALIAISLIGYQVFYKTTADAPKLSEQEFFQNMLLKGDVAKLDLIKYTAWATAAGWAAHFAHEQKYHGYKKQYGNKYLRGGA